MRHIHVDRAEPHPFIAPKDDPTEIVVDSIQRNYAKKSLVLGSINLSLDGLLAWHNFELVLPDLDKVGGKYDLEIPKASSARFTRIEMPWGIELTPASVSKSFAFTDPLELRRSAQWSQLWSSALVEVGGKGSFKPLHLEVLSARGFERLSTTGSVDQGNLLVNYRNRPGERHPTFPVPINDYNRMDIAASLSRRFPYTGRIGPPPIESSRIAYSNHNTCVTACFEPGRTVSAKQMRVSARGGWLHLEGKWKPYPGCALSGWSHSAGLGRDEDVELVTEGFLFPFGTPCELVIQSDRVFSKDSDGHFVSPLLKQAFLQIPQPNTTAVGHAESPFTLLSIITARSPPLDVPPTGDPATYQLYDFFLPTVNGVPFQFEHVGRDWNGSDHRSAMPMYFVSNKARLANGLIWEPGYSWEPTQSAAACYPAQPVSPDAMHTILPSGDGLRVVDKAWALQAGRFAQYNGALISLAPHAPKGETAQRVDWIEWTRANIPDLEPTTVQAPFRPRARTMRIGIQSTSQLSGEPSSSVATYRDVRFTSSPFLDPEPTTPATSYFSNVTAALESPGAPYLYMLETRPLVNEAAAVSPRTPQQVADDIRTNYYPVSSATSPIPHTLFLNVDNEIRFGRASTAEGVGGLSVPDTHMSTLTRKVGVLGDATFNERRWSGYSGELKARIQATQRLDFATYFRTQRQPLDQQPFDRSQDDAARTAAIAAARTLMQLSPTAGHMAFSGGMRTPGLKLGDLFGRDAQIIPGLTFADVFKHVVLADTFDDPSDPLAVAADEPTASPLAWKVRLTGIQWLTELLNGEVDTISVPEALSILARTAKPNPVARPLSMGMEATLSWTNQAFKEVDVGPVVFIPNSETKISIDAKSRLDLGTVSISPSNIEFSPGKPQISAQAILTNFTVRIFGAIEVVFSNISFEMSADGNKSFNSVISGINLLPPLDFINQIAEIFGGLGDDQGIQIDLAPRRVHISQTLQFPGGDQPLFMGPAQITNLALHWFVTIPLIGRDVLAIGFGVSSRDKPLTIWIPPWYGGKAYTLLELTTKGCRLVEVSMEYGALIPINWGIAKGQASLTAGIFYMLQRDDANNTGSVTLRAFVKAAANLSVCGIIQFTGLIYIALQSSGNEIIGVATISVSIKIGFVRISYSFSATHREGKAGSSAVVALLAANEAIAPSLKLAGRGIRRTRKDAPPPSVYPFGPSFSKQRRAAFIKVLAGYR